MVLETLVFFASKLIDTAGGPGIFYYTKSPLKLQVIHLKVCSRTLDMGGRDVSEPGRSRKLPRVVMFTFPSRPIMKLPMRPYRGARFSGDGSSCNKAISSHDVGQGPGKQLSAHVEVMIHCETQL
jgi:hypothetical protein